MSNQQHLDHEERRIHERVQQNDAWMVGDENISEKCYQLKQWCEINDPAFSDIRPLVQQDIYLISKNNDHSITNYLPRDLRDTVLASIDFDMHLPPPPSPPRENQDWCLWKIVAQEPYPSDYYTALKHASHYLQDTIKNNENQVDVHTAHAFFSYYPSFYYRSPSFDSKRSYHLNYLSPMIQSVFASNSRFTVHWSKPLNDHFQPDLLVSSFCGDVEFHLIIGEFNPPNNNNQGNASEQHLAKSMCTLIDDLVEKGIGHPSICGILTVGFDMSFYVMDMPCPNMYRLIHLANLTLFKTLDQMLSLPIIIHRLLQLAAISNKNITNANSSLILKP